MPMKGKRRRPVAAPRKSAANGKGACGSGLRVEGGIVRLSDEEPLQNGVASLEGNLVLNRPFKQTEGKTHDTLSGGISRCGKVLWSF